MRQALCLLAVFAACTVIGASGNRLAGQSAAPPRIGDSPSLIVILVIDQLRADYLERYSAGFTAGLRRLMREGAWFDHAAYPYLNTVTCPGHSTIGTGALPYRHGMILNTWWDRKAGKAVDCTDDPSTREVSYGTLTGIGDTGRFQEVPTLAKQMRDRVHGRTVTMSIKARSAIGLAGRKADVAMWLDERGAWTTSSAYAKRPLPWVQAFIDQHPIAADLGKAWERIGDPAGYQFVDDRPGERPGTGWTRTFPHVIGVPSGKADAAFHTQWIKSPFADQYVERMAEAAIDTMRLGSGRKPDFLGVSLSALDAVGHAFGPESHEVQDILARLDITIGKLLDHLDAAVGRGRYVLALGSDHGVSRIPEQVEGAGRVTSAQLAATVDAALQPILGPGKYVAYGGYTDIYLKPGVYKLVARNPKTVEALRERLRGAPGVAQVFLSDELRSAAARADSDQNRRAAALSHYPGRSGDIIIIPKENWILSTAAATHGTLQPYDQRVPVIFFGAGVAPGRYAGEATPADIAPTLAALARVPFVQTDGHVLRAALAAEAASK